MDSPWDWCPSRSAWLKSLRPAVERWVPRSALRLDVPRIREFLVGAIDRGEDWLYHPSLVALLGGGAGGLRKDIQLSLWAASHADMCLGPIKLSESVQCWTSAGPMAIPSGVHELAALRYSSAPVRVSLDTYSLSLGEAADESCGALPSISDVQMRTIKRQIRSFLSAVTVLESLHPDCAKWLCLGARVAIPLNDNGEDRTRSWSSRKHFGAVHLDICGGELLILEALVHEAAHCHLYILEEFGPLIEANAAELYTSPLRPDPRPLRGVLLAYHALAYICAFYSDAIARGLGDRSFAMNELGRSRNKLFQAERIIGEAESRFTALGRQFVRQTGMVAQYGCSASPSAA